MGKRLFLIFNHEFTVRQDADAKTSLGVDQVSRLPAEIRAVWGKVPPDAPEIGGHLSPVKQWLSENARPGDYVLVQGDFGASYLMVRFSMEMGMIPIYSTTRREAVEEHQSDGSVKMTHQFRHVRFRRYGV